MKCIKYYLLSGFSLFTSLNVCWSQDSASIGLVGFRSNDSIILTWQPRTYHELISGYKKGYELLRYEFDESLENIKNVKPRKIIINPSESKNSSEINKYFLGNESNKSILQMDELIQAEALQNRFSFLLMLAYSNSPLMEDFGIRWVDKEIKADKIYYYELKPRFDQNRISKILLSKNSKLPEVKIDESFEQNDYVEFTWSKNLGKTPYYGYEILRSKDNLSYEVLNSDKPFVGFTTTGVSSDKMSFIDSLNLYDPHYYKVVGLSIFGIKSEPSEAIHLQCRDRIAPAAVDKLSYTVFGDSVFTLRWENYESVDLIGHYIQRCKKITANNWETINEIMLPGKTTEYSYKLSDKKKSFFYRVLSVDTAGNFSNSQYIKILLLDSFPPVKPKGLRGNIDSNGVVTLNWEPNKEDDINGYCIYYANKKTHLFNSLTGYPVKTNIFRDTITLKTRTEEIYYRICAVDFNYNYSPYSDVIELRKPDRVPPDPPLMEEVFVTATGISLKWFPSTSKDLAAYELYRADIGSIPTLLKKLDKNTSSYIDNSVQQNTQYKYHIIAIDDAGLQSRVAYPVTKKFTDISRPELVEDLKAVYDSKTRRVTLQWTHIPGYRYAVYKSKVDNPMINVAYVDQAEYIDSNLQVKNSYQYAIVSIAPNKIKSPLSKPFTIKIKKS